MIDVSFFIPVYNPNPDWLGEAVESIVRLCQKSRVKTELLLGDDGSPVNCRDLLAGYQQKYPDLVRVFCFEKNEGVGATSTKLAKEAKGRYIASFDQDDIMLPFDLDEEIKILDENPQYSASYAQKFLFNEYGLTGDVHGDIWSDFLAFFQPKVNINAMLIRREALASHDYFKPLPGYKIYHDTWLMIRLAEDGDLLYRNHAPRSLYRFHSNQNSSRYEEDNWEWHLTGQDVITRHGELYRGILLGENLPEGKNARENALIDRLTGLAFFLNQQRRILAVQLIEKAVACFPFDPGAHQIRLLYHRLDDGDIFDRMCAEAMSRFPGNPDAQVLFLDAKLQRDQKFRVRDDAAIQKYQELMRLRTTPTQNVSDALKNMRFQQRPAPVRYSFTLAKPKAK